MPHPDDAAYRAELEAALAALEPQLRGLHDLLHVSISSQLIAEINHAINEREERKRLIYDVIAALDAIAAADAALMADGYPDLPPAQLDAALFNELQGQEADLDAAIEVFVPPQQAATMTIGLGSPEPKPQGE
jgi:hypothetical protein